MAKQTFIGRAATAISLLVFIGQANAWEPPIGIPAPPFGIEESHQMYAGQSGYSDAGNGPYTHYVDNSGSCSDSGNGSPGNPRCTIPETLSAGSVVEVHGGPYANGRELQWQMNGTAARPVFIRGTGANNKPVFFDSKLQFFGSYAIVEYIDADETDIEWPGPSDHIALRHSHVHDHPGTGAVVDNESGNYTVIYNNEINNHGEIPSAVDRHGVYSGRGSHHVWIVDNHIHHNSGDAIQFCHDCVTSGNGPANVYIGRNHMHDDEENAIDLKEFIGPVIISENIIHSYSTGPFSGHGEAIRINDEGNQGAVWLLFNDISDANTAIQPDSSDADVYNIGNIIHDINDLGIGGDADYVINNTFYNMLYAVTDGETKNNIIINIANIAVDDGATGCSNNLIDQSSVRANCTSTARGDPMFIFDVNNRLVGIESNSAAIGVGLSDHPVYQLFQSNFGIDIRVDANGQPRPVGASWSAGAHEVLSGVRPMPPTNLTVE